MRLPQLGVAALATVLALIAPAAIRAARAQSPAAATPEAAPPPSPAGSGQITIEDTRAFFDRFFTARENDAPRSPFETDDEYEKRITHVDTAKVYYLRVDLDEQFFDHRPSFAYDLPSQRLTFFAGENRDYHSEFRPSRIPIHSFALFVHQEYLDHGTYDTQNRFGTHYTVSKREWDAFGLNVMNMDRCPDEIIDRREHRFRLTVPRERHAAEQLTKTVEVIVGVRLVGRDAGAKELVYQWTPECEAPQDATYWVSLIDVDLVEVLLRDSATQEILARYRIRS